MLYVLNLILAKKTYVTGLSFKEFLAIKYQAVVVCGSNQAKNLKKNKVNQQNLKILKIWQFNCCSTDIALRQVS